MFTMRINVYNAYYTFFFLKKMWCWNMEMYTMRIAHFFRGAGIWKCIQRVLCFFFFESMYIFFWGKMYTMHINEQPG